MTSKNLSFKLMKEDAKRRLWAVALLILAFFFQLPVMTVYLAGEYREIPNAQSPVKFYEKDMLDLLSKGNGFVCMLIMVSAVVCGVSSFSYLHSKRKVDFYHSIPARREKLFIANYLNGILIVAVPYLFFTLISVAIASIYGASGVTLLGAAMRTWAFQMTYYMVLYGTVVVAVMMTGNLIVALLGVFVFFSYGPMTSILLEGCFETWFDTYYSSYGRFSEVQMQLSPFTSYLEALDENLSAWGVALRLLVALTIAAIALFLYKKRPSEAAGKAMAFPKSKNVICVLLVFSSSIAGAIFFWGMRESMGWTVFGLVCGCVLSHCVIEIIYYFDFKKLFVRPLELAVCMAVSLLVICCFRYDLFGYDRYLPKEGNVASAAVSIAYLDDWVQYTELKQSKEGEYFWEYEEKREHALDTMQLSDISSVLEIAEKWIEMDREGKLRQQPDVLLSTQEENQSFLTYVTVKYHLKSGRTVYRLYRLDISSIQEEISAIYRQKEYKNSVFPILRSIPENVAWVDYEELGHHYKIEEDNGLLEAYQADLRAMTFEDSHSDKPVARLHFLTPLEAQLRSLYESADEEIQERKDAVDANIAYYPVYESFDNTLAKLAEYDISAGEEIGPDDVNTLTLQDDRCYYAAGDEISGNSVLITQPDQIRELMDIMIFQDYQQYNNRIAHRNRLPAEIRVGEGKKVEIYSYGIDLKMIPSKFLDMLEYDEMTERLRANQRGYNRSYKGTQYVY